MLKRYKTYSLIVLLAWTAAGISSCKKYVDAGAPVYQLTADKVFVDSATTVSSVLSLYSVYMKTNTPYLLNLCQYGAMSADEGYYDYSSSTYDPFKTNTLASTDNLANVLYNPPFQNIYVANYNLEGLAASTSLSTNLKTQLTGECKFWRAFCYFNLLNYYGAVPLVTTTDVSANDKLGRTDTATVYNQIVTDLLDAKAKLTTTYSTYPITDRARINKYVVSAFLAKVYLYRKNWAAAEAEATTVIGSGVYGLETNLSNVFIKTSNEVIWQDAAPYSATVTGVTQIGPAFIPSSTTPSFVLYDTLAAAFEAGDLRKSAWTQPIVYNSKTFYYPYKYKIRITNVPGNEYYVMLRLAEQYLIRAEARAQQGNTAGAAADLNMIRSRAGLSGTTAATTPDLLAAILHERQVELFTEWGHRWLDLKRTGSVDSVMTKVTPQKGGSWRTEWQWYPISLYELQHDPNLIQNSGYQK